MKLFFRNFHSRQISLLYEHRAFCIMCVWFEVCHTYIVLTHIHRTVLSISMHICCIFSTDAIMVHYGMLCISSNKMSHAYIFLRLFSLSLTNDPLLPIPGGMADRQTRNNASGLPMFGNLNPHLLIKGMLQNW